MTSNSVLAQNEIDELEKRLLKMDLKLETAKKARVSLIIIYSLDKLDDIFYSDRVRSLVDANLGKVFLNCCLLSINGLVCLSQKKAKL